MLYEHNALPEAQRNVVAAVIQESCIRAPGVGGDAPGARLLPKRAVHLLLGLVANAASIVYDYICLAHVRRARVACLLQHACHPLRVLVTQPHIECSYERFKSFLKRAKTEQQLKAWPQVSHTERFMAQPITFMKYFPFDPASTPLLLAAAPVLARSSTTPAQPCAQNNTSKAIA